MSSTARVPPFPPDYRASGLLLHVTSLPSPYGIGDFGPPATAWIDRLSQSGQRWWQMLPLGPTGYGNSPYQPLSSFALNEPLISPDWLIEDELLTASDVPHMAFPTAAVDYDGVTRFKLGLLEKAWGRFQAGARADLCPLYEQFRGEQDHWLGDYALFRALKGKFNEAHYLEWPADLVFRKPAALEAARRELASTIARECFTQFLLFRQCDRMKAYAARKGIKLMGDLPFFVSPDSSDVWADPQVFLLDEQRQPLFISGVPPDYFSAQGQLWRNPVYDWGYLGQTGFRWWIDRLRAQLAPVDAVRLDHFRGFVAAWHVPAGAATAQSGEWIPGPGADVLRAAQAELGGLPCIAEDLGLITPDVYVLRDEFRLPGMRILQFAFDGHADNPYLPENYTANSVVYTGTHDNDTTRSWFENLAHDERERVQQYLKKRHVQNTEAAAAFMELAWSSGAALAMAPLQDLLNLGSEARMNIPGHADGNWTWRCSESMLSQPVFDGLCDLTRSARRLEVRIAPDAKTFEAASIN